jgi:ABC-type sugar transport system ATPase subunit
VSHPIAAPSPILEATGLTKRYDRVTALDNVDFAVFAGEVLAVVGDNGTGKSTLIKCLAGVESPDAGTIRLEGEATRFRGPNDARIAGINTLLQSLRVDPTVDFTAALFRQHQVHSPAGFGWLEQQLERRGLRTPRALSTKVVLLDEPTAALGVPQTKQVLALIRRLRERELGVVVISHNLVDVFEVADRIFVLRLGRSAGDFAASETTEEHVVGAITGVGDGREKPQADQAEQPQAEEEGR